MSYKGHKSGSADYYKYADCPHCHHIIRGSASEYSVYTDAKGGTEGTIGSLLGQGIGLLFGIDPEITKQAGRFAGQLTHAENNEQNGTLLKYNFTCPHCSSSFSDKLIAEVDTTPDTIIENQRHKFIAVSEQRRNRAAIVGTICFIICALCNVYTKLRPRYTIVDTVKKSFLFVPYTSQIKKFDPLFDIMVIVAIISMIIVFARVVKFFNSTRRINQTGKMTLDEFRRSEYRDIYEEKFENDSEIYLSRDQKYPSASTNSFKDKLFTWGGKHVTLFSVLMILFAIIAVGGTFYPNKKPVDLTKENTINHHRSEHNNKTKNILALLLNGMQKE